MEFHNPFDDQIASLSRQTYAETKKFHAYSYIDECKRILRGPSFKDWVCTTSICMNGRWFEVRRTAVDRQIPICLAGARNPDF